MKGRFWKKTLAACLALVIVSGGMPVMPVTDIFRPAAITASAVDTVTWNPGTVIETDTVIDGNVFVEISEDEKVTIESGCVVVINGDLIFDEEEIRDGDEDRLIICDARLELEYGAILVVNGSLKFGNGAEIDWDNSYWIVTGNDGTGRGIHPALRNIQYNSKKKCFISGGKKYSFSNGSFTELEPGENEKAVTIAENIEHGCILADLLSAEPGETITLDIAPEDGYALEFLSVKGADDTRIAVENNQFTMPDQDVTVSAKFTEIKDPAFRAHSLVLEGEIGVNFYMELPKRLAEGAVVTFYVNGLMTTREVSEARTRTENGKKYYYCTCYVTPLEMTDDITAILTCSNDLILANVYSVEQYIEDSEDDNFDETTRALINAIADYGSYVQPFLVKAHDISEYYPMPAKTVLTDEDVAAAKSVLVQYQLLLEDNRSDVNSIGYRLNLESRTTLKVGVKLPKDYTGTISATIDGKEVKVYDEGNQIYYVEHEDIAAHKLGSPDVITFTTESGSWTVYVSAMTYAYKQINKPANRYAEKAMTALYNYYAATVAYRAAHSN